MTQRQHGWVLELHTRGTYFQWYKSRKWKNLTTALNNGMRHQLRSYLADYRLRHTGTNEIIDLDDLLKVEIRMRCKNVRAC